VPNLWVEKLVGCSGHTYCVALTLLYEHWRQRGAAVKLPNGMLAMAGLSRQAKCRALRVLEKLELVRVEWRERRSPIVTVLVD
jgi:hypothetical protein